MGFIGDLVFTAALFTGFAYGMHLKEVGIQTPFSVDTKKAEILTNHAINDFKNFQAYLDQQQQNAQKNSDPKK